MPLCTLAGGQKDSAVRILRVWANRGLEDENTGADFAKAPSRHQQPRRTVVFTEAGSYRLRYLKVCSAPRTKLPCPSRAWRRRK